MIRHIVLTKFKSDVTDEKISSIYRGLSALTAKLDGADGFTGGKSNSPEQIERGYKHGFVIDFANWDALSIYAENSEHKALGSELVANAEGGRDGILVLDLEV